jgi:flagellar basal-body rod modification protein FlgD
MNPTAAVGGTTPPSLYGTLPGPTTSGSLLTGNTFMQLLVSELQNQDPTSPMSASDFISQMTSMSLMTSMEQLAQYMTTLGQVSEASAAVSLLGHGVTATTAQGTVTGTVEDVQENAGASSPTLVIASGGTTQDISLADVTAVGPPPGGSA